jgi:hypothetical protein
MTARLAVDLSILTRKKIKDIQDIPFIFYFALCPISSGVVPQNLYMVRLEIYMASVASAPAPTRMPGPALPGTHRRNKQGHLVAPTPLTVFCQKYNNKNTRIYFGTAVSENYGMEIFIYIK